MAESVRLVIWDLDETFWKGTLTEGGATYLQSNHDTVIELARRGIVSSICSRNEHATIEQLLRERGLWDYFIFPSINWESKGPRLAAIVEAVQLRPPTILFIDDNPMNRNEALHFVPGIQVSDETILADILADSRFKGKEDADLTRLAQYKLLEARNCDRAVVADSSEFLRASDIRVRIEANVEAHIDRAIELINRTNQLNFTKSRLPEDAEKARAALRSLIADYDIQCGLIQVRDRYGDYGYVGIYVTRSNAAGVFLLHFCFSCRTLGMGVENWVYDRLGRPGLHVVGEVLTDLAASHCAPDWITTEGVSTTQQETPIASRVLVRGGCDLTPVAHYLSLAAAEVCGEFNTVRAGLPIRADQSSFLRYALSGFAESAENLQAAAGIGYEKNDFASALAIAPASFDACVFSFWLDAFTATYQHHILGFRLPFTVPGVSHSTNISARNMLELRTEIRNPSAYEAAAPRVAVLHDDFEFRPQSNTLLAENLAYILDYIPDHVKVVILLAAEQVRGQGGQIALLPHLVAHNQTVKRATAGRSNVHLLQITDFVEKPAEMINALHFGRMVYFRLYERIKLILQANGMEARTNPVLA